MVNNPDSIMGAFEVDELPDLGRLHLQIGEFYHLLERHSKQLSKHTNGNHSLLFSPRECDQIKNIQSEVLDYQRAFFSVGETALESSDPQSIALSYESLLSFGKSVLSQISFFTLRVGDYDDALKVSKALKSYEKSHSVPSSAIESIVHYDQMLSTLVKDCVEGLDSASSDLRQLAKSGRRQLEMWEGIRLARQAKLATPKHVVPPVIDVPTKKPILAVMDVPAEVTAVSPVTEKPLMNDAPMEIPSGAWSTGQQATIPLDRVDTSSFAPVSNELDNTLAMGAFGEFDAVLPMEEEGPVSQEMPAAILPDSPPPPQKFSLQGPTEVELVLRRRKASAEFEAAQYQLNKSQAALDIQSGGSRVRKWVRDLFGKNEEDKKMLFEARKKVVDDQKSVHSLEAELKALDDQIAQVRSGKIPSSAPEFALEPKRVQLNAQIARFEKELSTLKKGLNDASARERVEWEKLFVDRQKAYKDCMTELVSVETEIYGQPMARIPSPFLSYNPKATAPIDYPQPLTLAGAAAPIQGIGPLTVSQEPIVSKKLQSERLSPRSGGVLIQPDVPQWRDEPITKRLEKSWLLRDAMSRVPAQKVAPEIIGGKAWADKPVDTVKPYQSDPGSILPPGMDARDALVSIKPHVLASLREKDPVTRDILLSGINSARAHMGVRAFDFNEYETLDRKKDVLPAQMAKIEDQITALQAQPTGLFARAKRVLFGGGNAEKLDTLRAQLEALQDEEATVHARLSELNLQVA